MTSFQCRCPKYPLVCGRSARRSRNRLWGAVAGAASVAAPGQAARPAQTQTIAQHVRGRGHGRRVPGLRADQELALQLAQVAAVAGELRDPGAQGPEGRAADYR